VPPLADLRRSALTLRNTSGSRPARPTAAIGAIRRA